MQDHSRPAPDASAAPGFLAFLNAESGRNFIDGFQRIQYGKGQLIATPESAVDRVFIVVAGRVRAYVASDERELTLSILEPGDIFSTHTPAYLSSMGTSAIIAMDTRRFAERMAAQPGLTPFLMRALGKLLNDVIRRIERLSLQDVGARLAGYLVETTRQRGCSDGDGWLVPLSLSLGDVALLLGTTRQTVSAHMSAMVRRGILERRGRHCLRVHRLGALEQWSSDEGRRP
ncbi:Crp/Fnr family transcriptional regulator [Azoarcus sp. L1K30]|uniref:Crp/Fnr family transcriptional regulator n=1 Tax=Azoarcus sp. L1K30 TaxID=2820277 RepID=UPI001B8233A5|nr:Crp/Fnr family transcriptional regulator [Azoarcus sp. L1K30]MBR0567483.1 Crp/Fnr family transcriptional regulator [Azoarcus sp. L1K30]